MRPWSERSPEKAHLLNPAFCCMIIIEACAGYSDSTDQPLPFALSFMVLPLTLHRRTRESLPRTIRTSIPAWLQNHTEARLGFHERLMALQPHTREAMRYGLGFGWIKVDRPDGIRRATSDSLLRRGNRLLDGEARDCMSRARFLGKWLGKAASTETTMALWGICP